MPLPATLFLITGPAPVADFYEVLRAICTSKRAPRRHSSSPRLMNSWSGIRSSWIDTRGSGIVHIYKRDVSVYSSSQGTNIFINIITSKQASIAIINPRRTPISGVCWPWRSRSSLFGYHHHPHLGLKCRTWHVIFMIITSSDQSELAGSR